MRTETSVQTYAWRVREVVEHHVVVDKWGSWKARLLQLVAVRQAIAGAPAAVPRRVLASLDGQGRGTHASRVLAQLARDRVLIRSHAGNGRAELWAVNPDVEHWRHVKFSTSARRAAAAFAQDRPSGTGHLSRQTCWSDLVATGHLDRSEAIFQDLLGPLTTDGGVRLGERGVRLEKWQAADQELLTAEVSGLASFSAPSPDPDYYSGKDKSSLPLEEGKGREGKAPHQQPEQPLVPYDYELFSVFMQAGGWPRLWGEAQEETEALCQEMLGLVPEARAAVIQACGRGLPRGPAEAAKQLRKIARGAEAAAKRRQQDEADNATRAVEQERILAERILDIDNEPQSIVDDEVGDFAARRERLQNLMAQFRRGDGDSPGVGSGA